MKTGYADSPPSLVRYRNHSIRIYYDVEEINREIDGIETTQYMFVYTDLPLSPDRGQIVDAIISNKYTKDAEIALINNELASTGTEKYIEYQAYRIHAKELADLVLTSLK